MRYDKTIRLLGSILFTIDMTIWLPIVIYVPALAFNQVTGIETHVIIPIVCAVCIFYTCVGGLKAVVWTDVVQTVIMIGTIIFVVIKGTIEVGGFETVWERNVASGRIQAPDITLDPTVRISVLSMFVGGTIHELVLTTGNQFILQRYLCLPGLKEARKSLVYFIIGVVVLISFTCYNGLLIYATYHDCDPLSTKLVTTGDQLVPLFVMDVLGFIPGLPGIFVASIFSAALSSLATGLNSLPAVVLEDFIKPHRKTPLTQKQTRLVMQASVVIFGLVSLGLVYVVKHLGALIPISITFASVVNGPMLSLFLMGFLMPWINGKSALIGCIASFCITTLIVIKAQFAVALGELSYATKPVATDGCDYTFEALNTTGSKQSYVGPQSFWDYIFQMSFFLYIFVGAFLTVIFSHLASLHYGLNDPSKVNSALLAPFVRRFYRRSDYRSVATSDANQSPLEEMESL